MPVGVWFEVRPYYAIATHNRKGFRRGIKSNHITIAAYALQYCPPTGELRKATAMASYSTSEVAPKSLP